MICHPASSTPGADKNVTGSDAWTFPSSMELGEPSLAVAQHNAYETSQARAGSGPAAEQISHSARFIGTGPGGWVDLLRKAH